MTTYTWSLPAPTGGDLGLRQVWLGYYVRPTEMPAQLPKSRCSMVLRPS